MKSVKKIIGIIGDFGFVSKNEKIFEDLDLLILNVKNEDDLEKCDGLFFGTSSFFQLQKFFGDVFFQKVLLKIENNFPVLCFGQSCEFFLSKIGDGNFEKKGKIDDFEGEIFLDFLDSKPMKIKVFKNFYYGEKKIFGAKKYLYFIKKFFDKNTKIEKFGEIENGKNTIFIYKKTLFTIFSPEFYGDKRIYEYFISNFI
ncbi:hypothetical protein LR002_00965 [Candidatus Gracilibacteria bacterium]|nr:hypothetical protein [Candidatus Gracilibacteria bacterium]